MAVYTVDSEAVSGAATAVGATVGRLQTEIQSLAAQLDQLQAAWTGQASAAFQAVAQQWRATHTNVEEMLAALDQALRQAAEQYREVESANLRLFG